MADGGVPTMTGRQSGGPQPNVQRVAPWPRGSDVGSSATGSEGRMARLMAAPQGVLADNPAVHSRSSDG